MLNWSDSLYALTLGMGSMAFAGMMSELLNRNMAIWCVLAIGLLPVTLFVFVHPDEVSAPIVRYAHLAASIWYVAAAAVLLITMLADGNVPRGRIVYSVGVGIGSIPCEIVLFRAIEGKYG